jgi:zinc protease
VTAWYSLAKSRARKFETLDAKVGPLGAIGDYRLPIDTVTRENSDLAKLDTPTVQQVAKDYMDTDHMIVVVVGDAATQAERLDTLGYGKPVMVPGLKQRLKRRSSLVQRTVLSPIQCLASL